MNLYFAEHINADTAVLSETESKHCIKAMRLRKGDCIQISDGHGFLYNGTILDDNPKACIISLQEKKQMPQTFPYQLHMAIAATKNQDRIEWFVEKAVEIGITEISLIRCAHSEKENIKTDRIERLMIAAMKQSLHYHLPAFHSFVDATEIMRHYSDKQDWQKMIAYCGEKADKKDLQAVAIPRKNSLIMIGPEGDFSPEEVNTACQCGFQTVSLGKMRLRTETAALYACCQIHFINYQKEETEKR